MNFKKHPLVYILLPLCVLSLASSFYRFFVTEDYIVEYEAPCDPEMKKCFIGNDKTTGEQYFYSQGHKQATVLRTECGINIADCELAGICAATDKDCSITYCTPETGSCSFKSILPNKLPATEPGNATTSPQSVRAIQNIYL